MGDLYIDYSQFELICWNTDSKGSNISIDITPEQAQKICNILGIAGFGKIDNETVIYTNQIRRR